MDAFSYLSVLLSIILGLAITQILQGFRGIVLARARLRGYWPTVVWAILLLIIYVQNWWAMFGLRDIHDWTFIAFSAVLLETIGLYLLAALVFPDFPGTKTIDLRAHYLDHTRWFFGLLVAVACVSVVKDLVLSGHFPDQANLAFHLFFIATSLAAAITRREWYHKALPLLGIVVFVTYTITLFARLH